jgi:pimeloyl-ACP methyl ester carboxylesterase
MNYDIPQHVALALSGGLALGVMVYVAVSYGLMRAHTDARPFGASLRAAAREVAWAIATQPLLPLYYFVGRKMGGRSGGVPVVFVHGYMQNRVDFVRLARALGRAGAGPLYGFNYPWFGDVAKNAARLERFVQEVCVETGAREIDLVCHSLGGLVATEMLRSSGSARVRRCATIASPHAGVAWRGPILGACAAQLRRGCAFMQTHDGHALPVPCLSVYSTHDNVVHPPATSTLVHRGGRDHVVRGVGHLSILFSSEVADAITSFVCDASAIPCATRSLSPLPANEAPMRP